MVPIRFDNNRSAVQTSKCLFRFLMLLMTGLKPGRKNPFITAVTHQIYFIWLCSARLTLPEWHIIYSRLWECSERSQHGWLPLILWKPKVQLRGEKTKRFGLNSFPETLQMELDVKTILDIQLKFTNTPCYILYFKPGLYMIRNYS